MNFFVRRHALFAGFVSVLIAWSATAKARTVPMARLQELLQRQPPPLYNRGVYDRLGPDNASIIVSLSRQRAYVMAGPEVAIDSPISSGKRAGLTPIGDFTIVQK